jgi:hypothetical protein
MKRIAVFAGCFFLFIFVCGSLFTPWAWKWNANSLQVQLFNKSNERNHEGSISKGAGWSKLSFFLGDWCRLQGPGRGTGDGKVITDSTDFHIAWVSPWGVTVRVRYQQDINGATTSVDKLIFVPAHQSARIDASPNIYITGTLE